MPHEPTFLLVTLTINAVFSAVSGALLIALASPIGRLGDLPEVLVASVGVSLLSFAAFVGAAARRDPVDRGAALIITVADFAWVVAAAAIIAVPDTMRAGGKAVLGALSAFVLVLGLAEAKALRSHQAVDTGAVREGTAPTA